MSQESTLLLTGEFNYDLIMFKEILINNFHLFHDTFSFNTLLK